MAEIADDVRSMVRIESDRMRVRFDRFDLSNGQSLGLCAMTPSGWTPVGLLSVGDLVVASDGKAYPVACVNQCDKQDTYRVHYSDGVSIVVGHDHLHMVRTNNDRQRKKPWRVMSVGELFAMGNLRYGQQGKSRNYDVPVVADVLFCSSDKLAIDPYVLGVLIGDGHLKGNIGLSSVDEQLIADVKSRLPAGVALVHKSRCDWILHTGLMRGGKLFGGRKYQRHPFRQSIVDMGLWGKLSADKFVPRPYLFASSADRLEMLRGLMDTDGHVQKGAGTCQFYSVSKQLVDDVVWLVRSLGGVPTQSVKQTSCNGVACQPCHIATFSLATHNPCRLERKAARWNASPRDNGRWIDRIEFERRQPTVEIVAGSPDGSYVVDHFVVTGGIRKRDEENAEATLFDSLA